jgi:Cu/Ag efflux protein CusF
MMKLCAIFLALTVAWAQTSPSKSVVGEVTSVDAVAKQLNVKGDDGASYIVVFDDNTSYLRLPLGEKDLKKAEKIGLSDVTAGDRLLARGSVAQDAKPAPAKTVIIMTKADVAKKQEHDRAEWQRRGIAGTVMLVNANTKEITINTHGRDAKNVVIDASGTAFRRYAADSVRFADTKPSSFTDVQPGDTIRALGDKNEDGSRFKAEELVSGSFQTIAAMVVSADPATGEVKVTDLQTKKPVTVKTNQSSMLRRLDERTAAMLARRMHADSGGPGGAGPGGAGGAGAPAGGPVGERPSEGRGGSPAAGGRGEAGGPGGPGGRGFGGGGGDLQQVLDRSPQLSLAELKKGDALIISSSKASDGSAITAMSLVAGVEPFLAAAPRTAGQVNLGSWNIEMNMPEQ